MILVLNSFDCDIIMLIMKPCKSRLNAIKYEKDELLYIGKESIDCKSMIIVASNVLVFYLMKIENIMQHAIRSSVEKLVKYDCTKL